MHHVFQRQSAMCDPTQPLSQQERDGTYEAISQLHKRLSVRKFGSDSNNAMKCMMHANVPHLDKTTAVYKL